jgi:hypothetical protein
LVELWSLGTKRCLVSAFESTPPYEVIVFDGSRLVSHSVFPEQDLAVARALEALEEAAESDDLE